MTGYGRGETDHAGTKFSVELNSVNRKQSDIVVNLPRDLAELEPRIRQTIKGKANPSAVATWARRASHLLSWELLPRPPQRLLRAIPP